MRVSLPLMLFLFFSTEICYDKQNRREARRYNIEACCTELIFNATAALHAPHPLREVLVRKAICAARWRRQVTRVLHGRNVAPVAKFGIKSVAVWWGYMPLPVPLVGITVQYPAAPPLKCVPCDFALNIYGSCRSSAWLPHQNLPTFDPRSDHCN